MRKVLSILITLTLVFVIGCSDRQSPNGPTESTSTGESLEKVSTNMQDEKNNIIPGSYIVVFSSQLPELAVPQEKRLALLEEKINELRKSYKFTVTQRYDACLTGFAATMDDMTADFLTRDRRIESIEQDRMAYASAQTLPLGINRIDADLSSTLAGNGVDAVTGVDAYVIDTGIQTNHPDLNVKGGVNYNSGSSYNDGNGHGTHVAGTIGAKDNTSYVVGVAPGVDLYAVRVLSNSGSGSYSKITSGVNWVTNRKAANSSRPMVANMSLGGYTGSTSYNSLDNAVKNSITAGVTYCIASGNSSADAKYYSPAHVTEAITVGAYSASNNTIASFSNYGSYVDILAPGVSVLSTYKGTSTRTLSGTSMASPHVAGTVALYLSRNAGSSPATVRADLLSNAGNPLENPTINISGRPATTNISVYAGHF